MKHANIAITVTQFRPLGGAFPVSAVFTLTDASAGISMRDGNIVVKGKRTANLMFHIADPAYVFVGAAFDTKTPTVDVGTAEFPVVTINRTPANDLPPNCLSIIDANVKADANLSYNYVLLIQDTTTGELGIIDPAIINEPGI